MAEPLELVLRNARLATASDVFKPMWVYAPEAALASACLLQQRIAIIAISRRIQACYRKVVDSYGLDSRVISIRALNQTLASIRNVQGDHSQALKALAEYAVDKDGADVIVLAGLARTLKRRLPVPVVDAFPARSVMPKPWWPCSGTTLHGSFSPPPLKPNRGLPPAIARLLDRSARALQPFPPQRKSRMNRLARTPLIARLAAAAVLTFASAMAPATAQQKLQIAGNFSAEHPSSVAVEQVFKKEVARLSKDQLQVDVFPTMQLGGAKENVDAVRSGTLAVTWVGAAFLSRIAPELEAVSLPMVFTNRETAFRVIDGPVGEAIAKKLYDKGFITLGWMELGMRHITNSRGPIRSMADLKGLKVRLQPNETHLATFRALGANPVAMDVKELYSALEQHVVDGQENPYTVISSARYGEVQKYLSNSGHFFDFIAVVASRKAFEQLKPEYQKTVREAMTATIAYQRKLAAEEEAKRLAELKGKMTYTEISPAALDEMRRATAPVIEGVKKRAGADLVNQVLAEVAKR